MLRRIMTLVSTSASINLARRNSGHADQARLGITSIAVLLTFSAAAAFGAAEGTGDAGTELVAQLQNAEKAGDRVEPAKDDAKKTDSSSAKTGLTVGILVFSGVQIIDYTGPYEAFGQAQCRVITVAEKPGRLTTDMEMTIIPSFSFADCPELDILVLPGGRVRPNPTVRQWVRERAEKAQYVLSVCNGAFFLGDAGLLDGLTATTTAGLIDRLQKLTPKCRVVRDQRFVDNGKIITSAGLSSGIDGALHVIEKLRGRGFAQEVALGMEYHWQPDVPYARANLADRHLRALLGVRGRRLPLPDGVKYTLLRTNGGTDYWEKSWTVRTDMTAEDLLKVLEPNLPKSWNKVQDPNSSSLAGGAAKRSWEFTDDEGHNWHGVVEAVSIPSGGLELSFRIRQGALPTAAIGSASRRNRETVSGIVVQIKKADYAGDRTELKRLFDALQPFVMDNELASRVRYWRGFAMWRRALNGFNDAVDPKELEQDLNAAVDEFNAATAADAGFVDAKIGNGSCLFSLLFLHRSDGARMKKLLGRAIPLLKEAQAAAPENPRLLWVLGPSRWNSPPERGGGQDKALATYQQGLEVIRKNPAQRENLLEPSWGEPELLMSLAWSNLNKSTPDLTAAENFALAALKLVPEWHYVRDILLQQIRKAKEKARPGSSAAAAPSGVAALAAPPRRSAEAAGSACGLGWPQAPRILHRGWRPDRRRRIRLGRFLLRLEPRSVTGLAFHPDLYL
ncbi:MAG TPA: DJ-1/PfpI family protein [Gemmataceae bacterium]|nr:DJ-1/PfpI family protein [Gemmataceae bacterium]